MCVSAPKMCQALNVHSIFKSTEQVDATTCFRDEESEGSGRSRSPSKWQSQELNPPISWHCRTRKKWGQRKNREGWAHERTCSGAHGIGWTAIWWEKKKKTIHRTKCCREPLTWSSRLSPTYLVINKGQTVPTLHRPQLLKGPIVLLWNCDLCSVVLSCFLTLRVSFESSCPSCGFTIGHLNPHPLPLGMWRWELVINWNGD